MYQALYRARRPEVFREVLGQEHIIKILRHQIETDSVSHAYLFCGTRGTGKTTMARLLAKALNCTSEGERPCGVCSSCLAISKGSFMDVIEIDAASNNGVDNIRELRESVKYPPQEGKKKVYIIDEVHMLSSGAFNALLKTLEEPPENVVFVLCTTEQQKLPQTILSRCMRLDFRRVPQMTLVRNMQDICAERGVDISEGALRLLAANADGSVRDCLSILDQVLASGDTEIKRDDVLEYLGTVGSEFFIELTEDVSLHKTGEALLLLDRALSEGRDAKQLMKDWNAHYRSLLITKFMKEPEDLLNMSEENILRIKEQSAHIGFDEIDKAILRISKTVNEARWSTQPRILMELDIVALSGGRGSYMREAERPEGEIPMETPYTSPKEAPLKQETSEKPVPDRTAETAETKPPEENITRETVNRRSEIVDSSNIDLDDLWRDAMEEGEITNGSFNLIRSWTSLKEVSPSSYTVSVTTDFAARHVQEKLGAIDKIMTALLKRPMKGSIIIEKNRSESKKISEPDYKKEIKEALGLDVTVED